MTSKTYPPLEAAARAAWRPPDRSPPWKWAEQNVTIDQTSPFPGKFRADTAPWTREFMEVFADNTVRDIAAVCSAQSSKTQTLLILLSWAIKEDPGPALWVMAAQDEAKTFCKTRLLPTLRACPAVADLMPTDRRDNTTLEINFASMPFAVTGANSESKLQSRPIRWLFLDEVRNYPPGALEMVLKRTRAFWNARRVLISTPKRTDDAIHRAFLAGDQRRYYVRCPKCDHSQPLVWQQMKWDTDATTKPAPDSYNYDALAATIRYECANTECRHAIKDTPPERQALARSGRWIRHNPNAPASRVSFTWNAILPPWVRWRDLVEEFLRAKLAAKYGALEPLETFVCESLGEPFDDSYAASEDTTHVAEVCKGTPLDGETMRFLTADVQKDRLYYVCRAWRPDGFSRLIDEGQVTTIEDLREKQKALAVKDRAVCIDSGYDTLRIYRACAAYGWTAFKGQNNRDQFAHHERGNTIYRLYSPLQWGDPGIGTKTQGRSFAPLFLFSDRKAKDKLEMLRTAPAGVWEIPADVSEDYRRQLRSWIKRQRHHPRTGEPILEWVQIYQHDHLHDCEKMQVVAALIANLLNNDAPPSLTEHPAAILAELGKPGEPTPRVYELQPRAR